MKKKIILTLLWLGLSLGQTFAATAPNKTMAAQQQEAEAAKAQIEQVMQPQAATADKRKLRLIEKAEQKMDKLVDKLRKIKRPADDIAGLLQTIGIILIIIGLVGIILGVLGIGGGYPAGGGALFLGLVLYLIAKYAL